MYDIQQVTNNSLQQQTLILLDGTTVTFTLYFMPMQYGWVFKNITYLDFVLNSLRVTVSPNMLNQFRNQIPFGIACFSKASREPSLQEDFASGAAKLYLLSEAECQEYADILSGQIPT